MRDTSERDGWAPPQRLATRPGRPTVRNTYQLLADGVPDSTGSAEELFNRSVRAVLGWLRQKFPTPLPPEAEQRASFDCEVPGQTLQCVAIPAEGVWSVRLVQ